MKTLFKLFAALLLFVVLSNVKAAEKISVSVLNIDVHGLEYTPEQLGNLVRLELEKIDTFEVMDRYDVSYLIKKNNLDISNCYGKIGLVEVGKSLNSRKMLSGSVDVYGETIIITFRLVDVNKGIIEKSHVREYLNLPKELQSMIRISIREMFGLPCDQVLLTQLTKQNTFESIVSNPDDTRLNLSGPRMGATLFTGEFSTIMRNKDKKGNGGFDLYPVMYQFGYQFEAMYLNEGNFQALFEFIPMITGIDQNVIMPSFTFLNGVRHNLYGWEFAVGPSFSFSSKADVYYDTADGKYKLADKWDAQANGELTAHVITRPDSRGSKKLSTSFVIAVGKTFKSGKMNFPVNFYCIPGKDGIQYGLSFGYNAKNKNSGKH